MGGSYVELNKILFDRTLRRFLDNKRSLLKKILAWISILSFVVVIPQNKFIFDISSTHSVSANKNQTFPLKIFDFLDLFITERLLRLLWRRRLVSGSRGATTRIITRNY